MLVTPSQNFMIEFRRGSSASMRCCMSEATLELLLRSAMSAHLVNSGESVLHDLRSAAGGEAIAVGGAAFDVAEELFKLDV
jgi:hypothetical protein